MPITVRDTFVSTLGPRKQDKWRLALEEALGIWRVAGLHFVVVEESPAKYEPFDVYDGKLAGVAFYAVPDSIRLVRQLTTEPDKALWVADKGGAAFFRPVMVWWKSFWRPSLRAHIAHEIGHCLGQWHKTGGIMGGGWKADEHELDCLRTYYQQV
jgi:hypothetical protein